MNVSPAPTLMLASGPEKIRRQNAGEVIDLLSRDAFSRLLECQICQEIPLPPIYICTNGHNICSYCHSRIKKCGLCSAKFPNTRNLTVENIINSCTFACMYESEGCRDVIKGEDMKVHITNCTSKPPPEFEALASPRQNNGSEDTSTDDDTDTDEGFQLTGTRTGSELFSGFARLSGLFNNHSDSSMSSISSISNTSGNSNTTADSSINISFPRPAARRSISLARLFRSPRSPTPPRPRPTGPDENFPRPTEAPNTNNTDTLRVELRDLFSNNRGRIGLVGGAISSTSTAPGRSTSSSSSSSSSEEIGSLINFTQAMRSIRTRERGPPTVLLSSVRDRNRRLAARNASNNSPASTRSTASSNVPSTAAPGLQFPFNFSFHSSSRNNINTTAAAPATSTPTSAAAAATTTAQSDNDFSPLHIALRTRSRSNASATSSSSSHSNGRLFSSSSDSQNEDNVRSRSPINSRIILRGRRGVATTARRSRQRLNLTPTSPFARNLITSLNSRSRVRRDLINDSDSDDLFEL